MDNVKNDYYYVKRILRSVETLTRYLDGKSLDDLLFDGFLRDAIENRFTKIAEDTSHLTKELITEVIDLKVFNSFDELYTKYPKKILGYKDNEIANPKDMNEYYSDDNINKYGALAIEISLF